MEFWGFIYDLRYDKRGIFNSVSNTTEYDEFSINSSGFKKFCINGSWVVSTSYSYLKKIDLKKYIHKADSFAKILFSTNQELLKFDFLEKGKFKKQLIIKNGIVQSNIGYEGLEIDSKTITELLYELLWDHFLLDNKFQQPEDSYFKTIKNLPYENSINETVIDIYLILNIPKAIWGAVISPILVYYLSKYLILFVFKSEGIAVKSILLLLIAWGASLFLTLYIMRIAFLEIKNYIWIRTKVLNDQITVPNKSKRCAST